MLNRDVREAKKAFQGRYDFMEDYFERMRIF